MAFGGVVFDLYGTLVDNYGYGLEGVAYQETLQKMGAALGLSPEGYHKLWGETYPDRVVGVYESLEAEVAAVAALGGGTPSAAQIQEAARVRLSFLRQYLLVPRPDAVETLEALRAKGVKTGLVSNCSRDTARLWPESPLAAHVDVPLLSCAVGLSKPDPELFKLACERLELEPGDVMYVADGEGHELAAAASVGMTAVLIRTSYRDPPFHRQPHVEPWDGLEVAWLKDVVDLVRDQVSEREETHG